MKTPASWNCSPHHGDRARHPGTALAKERVRWPNPLDIESWPLKRLLLGEFSEDEAMDERLQVLAGYEHLVDVEP